MHLDATSFYKLAVALWPETLAWLNAQDYPGAALPSPEEQSLLRSLRPGRRWLAEPRLVARALMSIPQTDFGTTFASRASNLATEIVGSKITIQPAHSIWATSAPTYIGFTPQFTHTWKDPSQSSTAPILDTFAASVLALEVGQSLSTANIDAAARNVWLALQTPDSWIGIHFVLGADEALLAESTDLSPSLRLLSHERDLVVIGCADSAGDSDDHTRDSPGHAWRGPANALGQALTALTNGNPGKMLRPAMKAVAQNADTNPDSHKRRGIVVSTTHRDLSPYDRSTVSGLSLQQDGPPPTRETWLESTITQASPESALQQLYAESRAFQTGMRLMHPASIIVSPYGLSVKHRPLIGAWLPSKAPILPVQLGKHPVQNCAKTAWAYYVLLRRDSLRMQNAMRWYMSTYTDTHPDDMIVKLVVAGESLCDNEQSEIKLQFRLFLSNFAYIGCGRSTPKADWYKTFGKLYDERSALVHGAVSKRRIKSQQERTAETIEAHLLDTRKAIQRAIGGYAMFHTALGSDQAIARHIREAWLEGTDATAVVVDHMATNKANLESGQNQDQPESTDDNQ